MKDAVTILFLVGIPASGKTTYARELLKRDDSYVRVNKDDLRNMLFTEFKPDLEDMVNKIQIEAICQALNCDKNIIIDNTNLSAHGMWYIKNFIVNLYAYKDNFKCTFKYKYFPIALEEAIKRDENRSTKVGKKVIEYFYNKYHTMILEKAQNVK